MSTPRRRTGRPLPRFLGIFAASAVLVLTGCSIPGLPGATGAPDPAPDAAVEHASSVDGVMPDSAGDLASGSMTHRVTAAANTLVLDYWTTENVAKWTSESRPIINVNAHLDGPGTGGAVRVTRFEAKLDGSGTVLATDTGSFALEPPFAYSSAVVLPANPGAASSRIIFTLDLLTETAPGSGIYARQTVVDALTIGYATPGGTATAGASVQPEG